MEYPFKDLLPLDEVLERDGYYRDWTHIDANTFHQISELMKFIREKGYGVDTREAIAQALERVYHDALISGNANMEVSMARKNFIDLAARLDASDDKLSSTSAEVTGARRGYSTLAESLGNLSVNMINKNLGKLDQTFMTDEFLQQMAGTTPINAVPADGSVSREKILDGAVTPEKTGFLKLVEVEPPADGVYETVNLIDHNDVSQDGKMIHSDGSLLETELTAPLTTTEKIPVQGSFNYRATFRSALFYDEGGNILEGSYINNGPNKEIEFTTPESARKVVFTVSKADIMTLTLKRLSPSSDDLAIKFTRQVVGFGGGEFTEPRKNLLEGVGVTEGKYINQDTAEILDAPNHLLTDFIEVLPNEKMVLTTESGFNNLRWVQFDRLGNYISGLRNTDLGIKKIEIPLESNADTIRFSSIFGTQWDSPDKWSLVYDNPEGEGVAYDQSLNTYDDVAFNSLKTHTLEVSGQIPTGTLSSPPAGLLSGDMWADTTDSSTHPIVRVML